jgi:hypothetical protein
MNYSENHYDTKDLRSDEDLLETFTPASEVEGPKDIGESILQGRTEQVPLFRQTLVF